MNHQQLQKDVSAYLRELQIEVTKKLDPVGKVLVGLEIFSDGSHRIKVEYTKNVKHQGYLDRLVPIVLSSDRKSLTDSHRALLVEIEMEANQVEADRL